MNIKEIVSRILKGIAIAPIAIGKALGIIERKSDTIVHAAQLAMPIIRTIAAATPTRKDDELIALAEAYGLAAPVVTNEDGSTSPIGHEFQIGSFLQDCALIELHKLLPNVSETDLRTALALAFTGFKALSS